MQPKLEVAKSQHDYRPKVPLLQGAPYGSRIICESMMLQSYV